MYDSLESVNAVAEHNTAFLIKNMAINSNQLSATLITDKEQMDIKGMLDLSKTGSNSYETKAAIFSVQGPELEISLQQGNSLQKGFIIFNRNPQYPLRFKSLMLSIKTGSLQNYTRFYTFDKDLVVINLNDTFMQSQIILQSLGVPNTVKCVQPDPAREPVCIFQKDHDISLHNKINTLNNSKLQLQKDVADLQTLKNSNKNAQENLTACQSDLQASKQLLEALQKERKQLETQRDELTKTMSQDTNEAIRLASVVSQQQTQLAQLQSKQSEAQKIAKTIADQINALKTAIHTINNDSQIIIQQITATQQAIQSSRTRIQETQAILNQLPAPDAIQSAIEDSNTKLSQSVLLYQETLKNVEDMNADIQALQKAHNPLPAEKAARDELAAKQLVLSNLQAEIIKIQESVTKQYIYAFYGQNGDYLIILFLVCFVVAFAIILTRKRKTTKQQVIIQRD